MGAPLDQIDEAAGGLDLGDVLDRLAGFPVRRVAAARRQVLAHVVLLDRGQERVGGDFFLGELFRHVALAFVAGEPAALLRKHRHLAIVDHDRHAVFVDGGLLAFLHHLVELGIAVGLPFLAVEALVLVFRARIRVLRLPLVAQVGILGVIRRLDLEIHRAVLAFDRHRLQRTALDQFVAHGLFLACVAGGAGLAVLDQRRPRVLSAAQPLVGRLAGIEQRHRRRRNLRPIDAGRVGGHGRCRDDSA